MSGALFGNTDQKLSGYDSRVPPQRANVFDMLRGACVISMVTFHYCYDLTELAGVSLPWFKPPFEDVWRASISWSFLCIAGIMCSFSRNNFKRGLRYSSVAFAVWAVTALVAVDVPISFGIIFCMAASTLVYAWLQKLGLQPRGFAAGLVMLATFTLLIGIPKGTVGIGALSVQVPHALYSTEWLSWLGFPGPSFSSGDYYPLLPYCLMYLTGASVGPWIREYVMRTRLSELRCRPLEAVGRHALAVYVIHQPILLVLSGAAFA